MHIRDCKHNTIKARALLDTCATANFISESVVKRLDLHVVTHSLHIGAINTMSIESRGLVKITILSTIDGFCKELTCLTIPTITDLILSDIFPRDSIKIPSNIRLADPEFHLPRSVDLLIGSGATLSMFSVGQINLSREGHDLYLQKTRLGWIVAGGTSVKNIKDAACYLTTLENQLNKFWDVEEIATDRPKSSEECECKTHFIITVRRDDTGRYIVRLPFRETHKRFGESRSIALKRLSSLKRKLNANATLSTEYTQIMEEYLNLGHMSMIESHNDDGFYMPHHAIIKEFSNTTKVRVVFDASAKTDNGVSLNDTLLVGSTIQDKLFLHLVRFRKYKFVITADIEKMYRQVLLHEDDRRYQQILWRRDNKLETFQLNTLTFGVSSSPFLAIRTIQKLADDEHHAYSRAAEILKAHLYVDDLLSGAETLYEARAIRNEIIELLRRSGFSMRQWASNNKGVINDLKESEIHANFTVKIDHSLKTLSISWNTQTDTICYSSLPTKLIERLTKRNVLSEIAKIFDPLGSIGPVVFYAKKLMQDVWRCGVQWDESVPQSIHTQWSEFTRQLELMNQISFDRRILTDDYQDVQLHGFSDASNIGYGACLYVHSRGKNGNIVNRLLYAKSRVAPIKTITIPRLELCGALLLARLYRETSDALGIIPNKTILWCDLTIVLHWLKTSPHLLKIYLAARVAEIQEITNVSEWRHVRSEDNSADAISRGQLPHAFVQNRTWFTGPSWLINDEGEWPNENIRVSEIPELKTNTCLSATSGNIGIFEKYSSYAKLRRIVAYCLRFRPDNKHVGSLCAEEIIEAEIRILKILQATRFSDEIKRLKGKHSITKSKFISLNPFLDKNELIRVGGRLQKSKLTFSQKHPILLSSRHCLTDQIIREIHETNYSRGNSNYAMHPPTEILVTRWPESNTKGNTRMHALLLF